MINASSTLGDIATSHPPATAVFLRHRLDFCCGGGQTLEDACDDAGIDTAKVLAEIEAVCADRVDGSQGWDTRPLPELVDHILHRYHEPLHSDLPGIVEAARRVERVHGSKPSCPRGLADHLDRVHSELQDHMSKEEQVLFPALKSGGRGQGLHMPIRMMMQEHDDHGASLRRTRELTSNFELPPEACGTWRALFAALEQLEADLMEHIHLENNVLFRRALGS